MNKKLIIDVIKSKNSTCPEIVYQNPLLDRNVAVALSKSFISILNILKQNSDISYNLRNTVLLNIRNLCRIEAEEHIKIDEKLTEVINEFYLNYLSEATSDSDAVNLKLEHLLLSQFKDLNIFPKPQSSINPEVVQALLNLNNRKYPINILKDVLHWKDENKAVHLLKKCWNDNVDEYPVSLHNDISIKLKKEIEKILLQICYTMMMKGDKEIYFEDENLTNICSKCVSSPQCFQICCNILNSIFIMTNFNYQIEKLVHLFIKLVKSNLKCMSLSEIYPGHLSNAVLCLDININSFDCYTKKYYIKEAMYYLRNTDSEYDLIMLLLHFPDWFDIYFSNINHVLK